MSDGNSVGELEPNPDKSKSLKTKSKPRKVLPTDRVSVPRQLEILRGYAAASGPNLKAVSNDEVGKVVDIHSGSVSNCNPFFLDVGLIAREKNGNVPVSEVFEFSDRSQWNADTAAYKLGPIFRKTWFSATLLPKLAFRQLSIDQAVEFLADEAGATPEYRVQLEALIEYLKMVGIVSIEGNTISVVKVVNEFSENIENDSYEAHTNLSDHKVQGSIVKESEKIFAPPVNEQHPFIVGLLKTLPDPTTEWTIAGRVKWLQAASNIFGLIYTTSDQEASDSIEINRIRL